MTFRGAAPTSEVGLPRGRLVLCGALASGLCVAMLMLRIWWVGRPALSFLSWNLFLAWVPLAFTALRALGMVALRRVPFIQSLLLWPLDVAWLLFLPNAPYLVTDLVHLSDRPPVPYWLDLLMFCAFAATGCWLGVVSLEAFVSRFRHQALVATVVCALCGYGVYLGRVLRLNSWDVVDAPRSLMAPLTHPAALLFSVAFALFFGLLWSAFQAVKASNVSTGDS